jgi:DNA-binding NarL/FixJ family response regulator
MNNRQWNGACSKGKNAMLNILIVEDNATLRRALHRGLEATGMIKVSGEAASGEEITTLALPEPPEAVLMDVALAGEMNGIQAAVALRREYARLPIVFYSIQDDEEYYRDFLRSGILSHYAYVRKSNYLLPESILPLLRDAAGGRGFIDPEIETRVQMVRFKDANDPLALLEPNEQAVVRLVSQGLTNEQIASRLGYRDARAVARTNGQIYTAWGLNDSTTDEKVARTRAALIYQRRELILWNDNGEPSINGPDGKWHPL